MQIKLWANFSKRYNSTKLPSEDDATIKNVSLKQPTDTEAPTFILEDTIASDWNYCQFLNNFYFINKIVIVNNNIIELQCAKDYLGTWKSFITQYGCFVERSESDFDVNMYDPTVSQNTIAYTASANTQSFIDIIDPYDGFYIIRVIGSDGIKGYALTRTQLANLFVNMFNFNSSSYLTPEGERIFGDIATQAIFNPFQYVVSVKWFPLDISVINTTLNPPTRIEFGWFTSVTQGLLMNVDGYFSDILAVTLPTPLYQDFRQYSNNWTNYSIRIPSIGVVPVDASEIRNGLRYSFSFDYTTGAYTFLLYDINRVIGSYETNGAIDVQISQLNQIPNITSLLSQKMPSAIPQAITDVVTTLSTGILNSMVDSYSISGSAGSVTKWRTDFALTVSYKTYETKDIPSFTNGRPLYKNVFLNTLTGFTKCAGASIEIPSHGDDKQVVNNFLNTGFYLE